MKKLNAFIDRFVYVKDKENPDTYWKGRFFIISMFIIGVFTVAFLPAFYIDPQSAAVPFTIPLTIASLVILVSVFFIYPRYGYRNLLVALYSIASTIPSWMATYYSGGGLYSSDMALSAVMVTFIFLISNRYIGFFGTIISIGVYVFFYYAQVSGMHDFKADFSKLTPEMYLSAAVTSFLLAAIVIMLHERIKDKYLAELKMSRAIIEEQKEDILSSISYAQRIQQARLPKKQDVHAVLPRSFFLNKPKDVLSGDFYFFHVKDQYIFLAAADCTGHGVPGAIMSMIASEKLEDAVLHSSDVSEILNQVNVKLKESLRQSGEEDTIRDGMDIVLCRIDIAGRSISYAGAQRPLWLVRKDGAGVEEIKGTKAAIGGHTPADQQFSRHDVKLNPGDRFYLCSDGYADTFSGKTNKKLTTKKFKQLLFGIGEMDLKKQEEHLTAFIEDWMAGAGQVDDILVIGAEL